MMGQGPTSGCGPEPAPEPPQVPDHELLTIIGRGAYGEVWLARNAVGTLRAVKVVHRDVKPSNVIFANGEAKLADAGLVARMDDAQSLVGTTGYIAPEGPATP